MRRNATTLIISMLLAGATARPALAQDAGPPPPPAPSPPGPPAPARESSGIARAEALMAEMVRAYAAAPIYRDRVTVRYSYGGAPRPPFEATMLLDRGTDARIVSGGNEVTAAGDRMTVAYPRYPDRYLEVPLERDVVATIKKLFGRFGGPIGPAAFRYGKPKAELVEVMGYGLPDQARLSGYREITNADGEPRRQITLISPTGSVAVNVDPETRFIDTIAMEYMPANAPVPNFRVTLDMQFRPEVLERLPEPINFDPSGRLAFSTQSAMIGNAAPESLRHLRVKAGESAPDFTLHTLEGAKMHLADTRGSAVVLLFWTWRNEDAQKAIHVMQDLADWAAAGAVPLEIWPVHAAGSAAASDDWDRTLEYWERHPFTIMSLIDEENVVRPLYGITGVPMLVLIDRDGKMVKAAAGLADIDAERLKKDILAALGLPPSGS